MDNAARILVVEDEVNVGCTLTERLSAQGYAVTWAKSAADVATILAPPAGTPPFDLALMDVGLPDGSGFDVARGLRERHPRTAIIFLTALGSPDERIRGLELGAEDYVTKPFVFKELLLRMQVALRRANLLASAESKYDKPLQVGRALIDLKRMESIADGVTTPLTHKQCAVLSLLLEKRGAVLSRDEILDRVWTQDELPTTRTVDNFILSLRKLIEPDRGEPRVIRSVRGVGYQLDVGAVREAS